MKAEFRVVGNNRAEIEKEAEKIADAFFGRAVAAEDMTIEARPSAHEFGSTIPALWEAEVEVRA